MSAKLPVQMDNVAFESNCKALPNPQMSRFNSLARVADDNIKTPTREEPRHLQASQSLSNPVPRKMVPLEARIRVRNSPSVTSVESNKSNGSSQMDWRKHYSELTTGLAKNKHKRVSETFSAVSANSRIEGNTRRWDVFRSIPRNNDNFEPRWTVLAAQAFKVVIYATMLLAVVVSGVIAKMCLLLMTSNLRPGLMYTPCKLFDFGFRKSYVAETPVQLPPNASNWFYWCLFFALCVPEILTFLRSCRHVFFRFIPTPSIYLFCLPFLVETLHAIGISLLVFIVLPSLDSVRGAMLTCATAVIPLILSAAVQCGSTDSKKYSYIFLDLVALGCQLSGLWLWPALDPSTHPPMILPMSLMFISLGWWENFVTKTSSIKFISMLGHVKEKLQRTRYKVYLFLSVWKMAIFLFCMILSAGTNHRLLTLFDLTNPFVHNITSTEAELAEAKQYAWDVWLIFLWLVIASLICYEVAKFACKVKMERFCYAVPVASIIPATIIIAIAFCESKKHQPCHFASVIPDKIFLNCEYGDVLQGLVVDRLAWAWLLWFASYLWTVSHIFTQKPSRLSKTDTLLILPMYAGLLVDQSLALNRRRQNILRRSKQTEVSGGDTDSLDNSVVTEFTDMSMAYSCTSMSLANSNADRLTKIYICATMWHETTTEMLQMLKSIIRMDEDQCARRNAQKYLKIVDPDYYELEAHIFFDDAWEFDDTLGCNVPNQYVRQMVAVVDEAASAVHQVNMKLRAPVKFDVPYGGRLVWTLPGDNRLFVHLKDKTKVRHKKRWSQVMYMYYLLGHRIMEVVSDVSRKQLLADNTFLLAIDGDSNFSPSSVQKLVDLMKKQARLGSACGRIHPIGAGFMVWYQKFEYAIGHWFQKAAEHVFGCVLCAPGCFSLFRGSALMDDNVMNKYTKLAAEARHFVQYDQGEDRWLSTLMLKQGYRIEYAAAADADTYAPEGFDEFFNQRRRWTPSSVANTVDLLADYKRAVTNNDSISKLYIAYQTMVIVFSMLGPAIIFTMMVFAQAAAFRVDSWQVLVGNLVPIILFICICFIAGSNAQLVMAKLLGVAYAFIMMAVLVGTGIQIVTEGVQSPIAVFVIALAGVFCLAGFFHPREFTNIFYGAVFFLCIPCTYVVMSLYALINLNVINWGTREAAQKAVGKVGETVIQSWIRRMKSRTNRGANGTVTDASATVLDGGGHENGSIMCACDRLCRCILCADGGDREPLSHRQDEQFIWLGTHLERLDNKLEVISGKVDDVRNSRRGLTLIGSSGNLIGTGAAVNSGGQDSVGMSESCQQDEATLPLPAIMITSATHGSSSLNPLLQRAETHGPLTSVSSCPVNATAQSIPAEMSILDSATGRYHLPELVTGDATEASPPIAGRGPEFGSIESLLDEDSLVIHRQREQGENGVDIATPAWMQLDYIQHGQNDILDEVENQFWTDLIETYLKPIVRTAEEEATIALSLKELRNKIAFALLLINGLLIMIIYLLQLNKELLSITWNPSANYSITKYDPQRQQYVESYEPLKIEPIGFTIILFLSVILIVQTAGMFLHRLNTLAHVLASTVLPCFRKRRSNKFDGDELLEENAVEIAKNLQKLMDDDTRNTEQVRAQPGKSKRRRIIFDLEKGRKRERTRGLQQAFQKRFLHFNPDRHKSSLRGIAFDKNAVFPATDSAKKAAADAIRKLRDSHLRESAEKKQQQVLNNNNLKAPGGKRKRKISKPVQRQQEHDHLNSADQVQVMIEPQRLDYGRFEKEKQQKLGDEDRPDATAPKPKTVSFLTEYQTIFNEAV